MTPNAFACPDNRTIDLNKCGPWAAFALLGAIQVTLIATITVITVALPAIQRDLRVDSSGMVLITSAYGVAFGGLLLLGGRLADAWGRKRMLVAGLSVFGLGAAAASLAPDADILLAARFAQGVGAAVTAPAALALARLVFPEQPRSGRAMAIWGVLSSAGATAGTVLSGVAIGWVSWRCVFLVPIAISVIVAPAVGWIFPADQPSARGRIDWLGAVAATGGLTLLGYGVQRSGWAALGGVLLLGLFAAIERRALNPLLPLPFLTGRVLPLAAVAVCAGAMATSFYLLSLYLQQAHGLTTLRTSAAFLLAAPAILASGPLAAWLMTRLTRHRVLAIGLAAAACGLLLLSVIDQPYAGLLVFPLGAGVTFSAATVAALHGVRDDQAGLAGGLLNTAVEIGPPIGLSVLVWIATAHSPRPAAGYPFALRVAAAALLVIAVFSALPRRTQEMRRMT